MIYFLFDFVGNAHLVPGFASGDLGDGILGLVGVVVVGPHQYIQITYLLSPIVIDSILRLYLISG